MTKGMDTVVNFCLEHAESAPVSKRVSLYRGLAEICSDKFLTANFNSMADDLEHADSLCREFHFKFKNRDADHNGGNKS